MPSNGRRGPLTTRAAFTAARREIPSLRAAGRKAEVKSSLGDAEGKGVYVHPAAPYVDFTRAPDEIYLALPSKD